MPRFIYRKIVLFVILVSAFCTLAEAQTANHRKFVSPANISTLCSAANGASCLSGSYIPAGWAAFMGGVPNPGSYRWYCRGTLEGQNNTCGGGGTDAAPVAPPVGKVFNLYSIVSACPVGTVVNTTTYECETPPPPPPECSAGGKIMVTIQTNPSPFYNPPAIACGTQSGVPNCQLELVGSFFEGSDLHSGYRYNGTDCNGEEDAPTFEPLDTTTVPNCTEVHTSLMICEPSEGNYECYDSSGVNAVQCPTEVSGTGTAPTNVCGFVAGDYTCVDSGNQYCGIVNGEVVCMPRGTAGPGLTPISATSPDNPINGGNANGDSTDDIFVDDTEVGTTGSSPDDIKRVVQDQRTRNLVDTLDGVGSDSTGDVFDCVETPDILACEQVDSAVISEGEGALGEFEASTGDLGIQVQSYIDILSGYTLGSGPDLGPYYNSCPLMGIAGFPEEVDVSLICEITGGPVKVIIELMGLIMAAILLIKGISI